MRGKDDDENEYVYEEKEWDEEEAKVERKKEKENDWERRLKMLGRRVQQREQSYRPTAP